jgi:hypothetical protein
MRSRVALTVRVVFLFVALALPAAAFGAFDSGTTVDGNTNRGFSVAMADIDHDGDLDLLSAVSAPTSTVSWFDNVDGLGTSFTEHSISTGFAGATSVDAGDIDGDGDLDVLAAAFDLGDIVVFRNDDFAGTTWTPLMVDAASAGPRRAIFFDLDEDGDLDVVAAANGTGTKDVGWYENTIGDGSAWSFHAIDATMNGARGLAVGDIDADGDPDVVASAEFDDQAVFYENFAGIGLTWAETQINTSLFDGGSNLVILDLDGDGALDVAGVAEGAGTVVWWRNSAGDGSSWTESYVSPSLAGAYGIAGGDFDGDGDPDLATASRTGQRIDWWENAAGDGSVFTQHTIETLTGAGRWVAAGDLDGDRSPDLAMNTDLRLEWWRNLSPPPPCPAGFTGPLCEIDIDECAADPCVHGSCTDQVNGYSCSCEPGWDGQNCDADFDDCSLDFCVHGACVDGFNSYSCICEPGWRGELCGTAFNPALPALVTATTVCRTEDFAGGAGTLGFGLVGDADQGSAVATGGRLRLTSDGTALYHGTDNGGFAHQTVTGNFRAEVQLLGFPVNAGGGYRRSGLTVRAGTGPNDPRVYVEYLPHHPAYNQPALMFDYRGVGGVASELASTKLGSALPLYLAIDRRDNSFTAWYSSDGVNWIKPVGAAGGTIAIDMPRTVEVGVMSASYDAAITLTSEFDNFELCQPTEERLPPVPEAVACVPERPLDLVYLLDASGGSTAAFDSGTSHLDASRQAIAQLDGLIAATQPGSRAALVAYRGGPAPAYATGAGATTLSGLTTSLSAVEAAAASINLATLNPSTSSPVAIGLDKARQLLLAQGDPAHRPVVVLLGDGAPNVDFAGRGPQHYKTAEMRALAIRDGFGFLNVGAVGQLGNWNGAISTWDGEALADAMYQALRLKADLPAATVHAVGLNATASYRADLLSFIAEYGGGRLFEAGDLAGLASGIEQLSAGLACVPVDPCDPDPCFQGFCSSEPDGFSCACEEGWTGPYCEEPEEGGGH